MRLIISLAFCLDSTADPGARRSVQDAVHEGQGAIREHVHTGKLFLDLRCVQLTQMLTKIGGSSREMSWSSRRGSKGSDDAWRPL